MTQRVRNTFFWAIGIVVVLVTFWLIAHRNRSPELLLGSPAFDLADADHSGVVTVPVKNSSSEYIALGEAYYQSGKLDQAQAAYQQALVKNGAEAETYRLLGNIARDQGKYEDAVAYYRQAIGIDQADTKSVANLASVYYLRLGDKATAIQLVEESLQSNQGNESLTALLAEYQTLP